MQLRVWLIAAVAFALLAAACADAASAGHVLIAAGVQPGYRGVARSMHVDGRLRAATARRLWPGWSDLASRPARHPDADRQQVASFSNVSHPERRDQ